MLRIKEAISFGIMARRLLVLVQPFNMIPKIKQQCEKLSLHLRKSQGHTLEFHSFCFQPEVLWFQNGTLLFHVFFSFAMTNSLLSQLMHIMRIEVYSPEKLKWRLQALGPGGALKRVCKGLQEPVYTFFPTLFIIYVVLVTRNQPREGIHT